MLTYVQKRRLEDVLIGINHWGCEEWKRSGDKDGTSSSPSTCEACRWDRCWIFLWLEL